MPKTSKSPSRANRIIGYTLPTLHTGKEWYVDFYQVDPVNGSFRRKKYFLTSIKLATERKAYATELIISLTAKLRRGWNVWTELGAADGRSYSSLQEIRDRYKSHLERMQKVGTLKLSSVHRMLSFMRNLYEWIDEHTNATYVYQITPSLLNDFLDHLFYDREVNATTRNNYRKWLVGFCGFLKEKRYLADNPAEQLTAIDSSIKNRDALTANQLADLRIHLEASGERHYLLACYVLYYGFIRPGEMTTLRVGDVSLSGMTIRLSAKNTKNRKDAVVALNEHVARLMVDLGVLTVPSDYYLFSSGFRPGTKKLNSHAFAQRWAMLREELSWPMSLQFYSLKDSGIRDLANAEGIVVARDQARHSDVSTTNMYLKGDSLRVHSEAKRFKGKF